MISLPTIASLAKASLIYLTAAAFLPAAAARPSFDNETTPALKGDNDLRADPFILVKEPWPAQIGMPPQFNIKISTWQLLRKRECLENGSNFCFGNEIDSCPDCGGCCKLGSDQWCCKEADAVCCSGKKCCAAGSTCCGNGCCAAGSKCNDGKCEVPVVTTTITTTIHKTLTHTEMEMVTVQNLVVETSTINSIVMKTVTSNDGTQTEVTYSTTTVQANAKRSAEPTPGPVNLRRRVEEEPPRGRAERAGRNLWRNLVYGGEQALFDPSRTRISPTQPRQCSATTTSRHLAKRQGGGTSTSTVTETKTETDHTTVHDKKTTTIQSTSVSEITIFQTSTKVVGAKTTVSTTSVITITARKANTQVVTSTSTYLIDPTGLPVDDGGGSKTNGDPSLNDPSSGSTKKKKGGLSSSAIIGIGVGSGLVGLTLLLALFFWRRHQKNKEPKAYDFTYSPAPQMTSPTPNSPRRPTLPFSGAAVVPASHHDTSYTPTVSEMHSDPTPDSYNKTSGLGTAAAAGAGMAVGAAAAGRAHHTRNSSSVSKPLIPSGQPSPDPYRDPYRESGQSWPTNANEMPNDPRYELGDEEVAPAPLRMQQQYQQGQYQQGQYQQGQYQQGQYGNEYQSQQQPPAPPPRNQYRTGPHPSTSSISRVTRFAELDGGERMT